MMEPEAIGREIEENIQQLVAEWERVEDEEPWASVPTEDRLDHLPETIQRLTEAALVHPTDPEAHRKCVRDAAIHGEHRREHGFAEPVLFKEYEILREALWRYVRGITDDPDARLEAITRLDTAITLASRASLYGFHRRTLEEQGQWPEKLETLISKSPFLGG